MLAPHPQRKNQPFMSPCRSTTRHPRNTDAVPDIIICSVCGLSALLRASLKLFPVAQEWPLSHPKITQPFSEVHPQPPTINRPAQQISMSQNEHRLAQTTCPQHIAPAFAVMRRQTRFPKHRKHYFTTRRAYSDPCGAVVALQPDPPRTPRKIASRMHPPHRMRH